MEEELNVLESIFGEDFTRLEDVWNHPRVSICIRPHVSQGREEIQAELLVTYVDNYPIVAPRTEIKNCKRLGEEKQKLLDNLVREEARKLSGHQAEPFIFDLTRVVQDFLVENRTETKSFYEEFQEKQNQKFMFVEEQNRKAKEQAAWKNAVLEERVQRAIAKSPTASPLAKVSSFSIDNSATSEKIEVGDVDIDGLLSQSQSKSRYLTDFEEIKVLGFGGFGKVVKARNRLDGRFYAVKRIKLERQNQNANRKTLREVTSLAKMFNQYIVRYYQAWIETLDAGDESSSSDESDDDDFGCFDAENVFSPSVLDDPGSDKIGLIGYDDWEDFEGDDNPTANSKQELSISDLKNEWKGDKVLYIQMEYCPGQNLREVIDKGVLAQNHDLVWKLFRQMTEALWYVHGTYHFIHRDLKPANIFLDGEGNVKLGDFGLVATTKHVKEELSDTSQRVASANLEETTEESNTEFTNGVGTTLYRAPEVASGKYDEKCDMWSLGVMLFEMLVPPFSTGMERIRVLTELRKSGQVESHSMKRASKELIEMLLRKNPQDRPSALHILESGKLPRKIETEQRYFQEVMRAVKGADHSLPLYTQLMGALFEQRTRPEVFYTYDADILKYVNSDSASTSKRHHSTSIVPVINHEEERRCYLDNEVFREMEKQFQVFGATPFSAPLLTPKTDEEAATMQQIGCQLMDPQGTIVLLPTNLTQPFARWVALRQKSWAKRYEFSRVYMAAEIGSSLLGGQPRSRLQASLDIIVPSSLVTDLSFSKAWHADAIRCSLNALYAISGGGVQTKRPFTVYVQDFKLQKRALAHCGIPFSVATLNMLDSLMGNTLSWTELRKKCLAFGLSQKQTDLLRPFMGVGDADFLGCFGNEQETALLSHLTSESSLCCVFRPWLVPIQDLKSGLYFAIVCSREVGTQGKNTSKKVKKGKKSSKWNAGYEREFVAASGGRYDDLVEQYQLSSSRSARVAAVGIRFHIDRIVSNLKTATPNPVHALVGAPSDDEPMSIDECVQLVRELRGYGIHAEWTHPYIANPTISEEYLAYCKENGISLFINKRNENFYRVRHVDKLIDKDFPKVEQLVTFIKSN